MSLPAKSLSRPSVALMSSLSRGPLTSAVSEMLPDISDIMVDRKGVSRTAPRLSMTALAESILSFGCRFPAMSITFLSDRLLTREKSIISFCSSQLALTARSPTRLPDSITESAAMSADISYSPSRALAVALPVILPPRETGSFRKILARDRSKLFRSTVQVSSGTSETTPLTFIYWSPLSRVKSRITMRPLSMSTEEGFMFHSLPSARKADLSSATSIL